MADNNVEFEIRMKDEATKVFSNFKANISTQSVAVQQAFQGIQRSSGDATQTLIGFNRVIQDAPYGIMGIANNLNPLYESFVRLKNETGSTSGAFSAMTSALMGPAGVGIAIAAVSSLAVTFGKDMFQSADISQKKLNDLKLEAIDLKVKLGELTLAQAANRWNEEISKAEVSLFKLKQTTTDWQKTMLTQGRYGAIQKMVGTPEEIQQAQNDIDAMKGKVQDLFKGIEDKNKDSAIEQRKKEIEDYKRWLDTNFKTGGENDILSKAFDPEALRQNLSIAKSITLDSEKDKYKKLEDLNKQAIERNKWAVQQMAEDYKKGVQEQIDAEQRKLQTFVVGTEMILRGIGTAFGNFLTGQDANARAVLKSVANSFITMAETAMFAASSIAAAKGIATFYASLVQDTPKLIAGFTMLETARAAMNKMHTGGTVGSFASQPAAREFPILVRGGETVRTEGQERDLQNRMGGRGGGGTVIINFNSPVSDDVFVMNGITKALRKSGMTIDKLAVNQRSAIALT